MIQERQFVCWQELPPIPPSTKNRKVPHDPRTGRPCDHLDPSQWMTYTEAAATGWPVGFVLTADDPYFVIDVDGVKDATGAWDPRALGLLNLFPRSFAEISVSGNGFHIWGRCDPLALGSRKRKFETADGLRLEFYTDRRFMALGPSNNGGNVNLDWTSTLAVLVPISSDPADAVPLSEAVDPTWNGPNDDDELISIMLAARGSIAAAFGDSATVADLWDAREDVLGKVYPSTTGDVFDRSSADQALMNHLCFFTGRATARMDRLFRRSGLMREKWDKRADYRSWTISKAVQSTRNVYARPRQLSVPLAVPDARSFTDIISEANNLSADDITAIERLCDEAAKLSPIKKDAILRQIRSVTGISMAELKKAANGQGSNSEPDHRELAQKTIAVIGAENIIHAGQFTWKFDAKGVWKQCDDRELKQRVQATLAGESHAVTASRVGGVAEVLKNEIFKSEHAFNRGNPESVNCLNGELELTGDRWQLQPHRRDLYRTTQIPVAYDPNARAPMFERFLLEIFRDDADRKDKITVVLEMLGYSLMSHANREKFMLLIGAGANGKSVLLATLEALAGKENVAGVQPSKFDSAFQRAHLDQKLVNVVTELKVGQTIADAELKAITSGDPGTVEHKHGHPFVMHPFATCWFGTNHMPHTRDYSDAFFRRAIVVTCNRVFAPHEQDPNLREKLAAELPGILNHALNAYAQVIKRGVFTVPSSSVRAEREWRLEADQVAQFVEDRCEVRADSKVTIAILYATYQGWAQAVGIRNTLGQRHFCDRLEQLHFKRSKGTGNTAMIAGLSINGMPSR